MKEQFKQTRVFAILATMILMVLGASVAIAQLPDPGMQIDPTNTALVVRG
jgi:hypothetical protein